MTDQDKDLIKRLRAGDLGYNEAAADRIEKLQLEITSLNTVIDMLHVAWDQTTEELQRENDPL